MARPRLRKVDSVIRDTTEEVMAESEAKRVRAEIEADLDITERYESLYDTQRDQKRAAAHRQRTHTKHSKYAA